MTQQDNFAPLINQEKQNKENGRWLITIILRYGFLLWLFTYGDPDLLEAIINFINFSRLS